MRGRQCTVKIAVQPYRAQQRIFRISGQPILGQSRQAASTTPDDSAPSRKFQVEVPSRIVRGRRAARSRSAPSGGCGAMGASAGGPSSKAHRAAPYSSRSTSAVVSVSVSNAPDCCALHPLNLWKINIGEHLTPPRKIYAGILINFRHISLMPNPLPSDQRRFAAESPLTPLSDTGLPRYLRRRRRDGMTAVKQRGEPPMRTDFSLHGYSGRTHWSGLGR